jgi:hypothetical protein
MDIWLDLLFGSWIGILSLFTICFIIGMAIFLVRMMIRKMNAAE